MSNSISHADIENAFMHNGADIPLSLRMEGLDGLQILDAIHQLFTDFGFTDPKDLSGFCADDLEDWEKARQACHDIAIASAKAWDLCNDQCIRWRGYNDAPNAIEKLKYAVENLKIAIDEARSIDPAFTHDQCVDLMDLAKDQANRLRLSYPSWELPEIE